MRLSIAVALAIATTPIFGFQGRPGGDGAGRGAPAHGPNAIVGRVTDSAGKPVAEVFVTALRPLPAGPGERPFSFVSALLHTLTDANGEYRLDGLSIGDYFIVALPKNDPGTPRQPTRMGYGKTFYPSAGDVKSASKVHVSGCAPAQADLTLVPARLAIVSGVVIAASGQPAQGGTLAMTHGDGLFGLDSHGYRLPASGAFGIPSVSPGTYFLVFHESAWPPPHGETPTISQIKIVVTGDDMPNVRVTPIHTVPASGRVLIDPVSRASAGAVGITIGAGPVDFDGNPGPARSGVVQPDMTFSFGAWPGPGRLHVSPAETWTIKSIRLNGADITTSPIDFVEGQEIKGLEIEILRRTPGRGAGPSKRP